MREFLYLFGVLGLMGAAIGGAAVAIDSYSCTCLGKEAGVETKYAPMAGGCFVKIGGRWVPRQSWRNVE